MAHPSNHEILLWNNVANSGFWQCFPFVDGIYTDVVHSRPNCKNNQYTLNMSIWRYLSCSCHIGVWPQYCLAYCFWNTEVFELVGVWSQTSLENNWRSAQHLRTLRITTAKWKLFPIWCAISSILEIQPQARRLQNVNFVQVRAKEYSKGTCSYKSRESNTLLRCFASSSEGE
jgi:hypothetical protein